MKVFLPILLLIPAISLAQVVNPPSGSSGGCSSGTTTNLLSGDGAGGCTNSTIASSNVMLLNGTQTSTGTKTFGATNFAGNISIVGAFGIVRNTGLVTNFGTNATGFGVTETMTSITNTSGNSFIHSIGNGANAFTPASGTANFAGLLVDPVINGTSSGTANALLVAPVTNTLTGGTVKLASFGTATGANFAGYVEKAQIDLTGNVHAPTAILGSAATTAGQIGYDSTGSRFSAFTGGLVGTPERTIFTMLANTPTITATTTPGSILNGAATVQGTTTLPSGYITAARKFRVGISGVFSLVSTDTMTVAFSIGGTTVATTAAMNLGSTVTNGEYNVDLQVTCRSIAANVATCVVRGWTQADTATGGQRETYSMFNGGNTFTVPTNAANLLDVTLAFSSASASDSATSFSAGVYEIN